MNPRPLLHRLIDLEHALKVEGWRYFAADMREAIEEIERLRKLTGAVDVRLEKETQP